jgi:hypothetical protein
MKIIPKLSLVACCVAAVSTALLYAQSQAPSTKADADRAAWVENCLKDFETIKPGMTRGDIEKKLRMDGGLHTPLEVRFVHPACQLFKIDVQFDFKRDAADQGRAIWGKDDKATKVSKPYIERPIGD